MGTAVRRCAGCGSRKPKLEMVRIGSAGWTVTRGKIKLSGRGAYVCPALDCIEGARRRGSLDRSIGKRVPEDVYEKIVAVSKESH
ncbi:MAG: YlxR family protein [Candidatus Geothermincolia bacterium]